MWPLHQQLVLLWFGAQVRQPMFTRLPCCRVAAVARRSGGVCSPQWHSSRARGGKSSRAAAHAAALSAYRSAKMSLGSASSFGRMACSPATSGAPFVGHSLREYLLSVIYMRYLHVEFVCIYLCIYRIYIIGSRYGR